METFLNLLAAYNTRFSYSYDKKTGIYILNYIPVKKKIRDPYIDDDGFSNPYSFGSESLIKEVRIIVTEQELTILLGIIFLLSITFLFLLFKLIYICWLYSYSYSWTQIVILIMGCVLLFVKVFRRNNRFFKCESELKKNQNQNTNTLLLLFLVWIISLTFCTPIQIEFLSLLYILFFINRLNFLKTGKKDYRLVNSSLQGISKLIDSLDVCHILEVPDRGSDIIYLPHPEDLLQRLHEDIEATNIPEDNNNLSTVDLIEGYYYYPEHWWNSKNFHWSLKIRSILCMYQNFIKLYTGVVSSLITILWGILWFAVEAFNNIKLMFAIKLKIVIGKIFIDLLWINKFWFFSTKTLKSRSFDFENLLVLKYQELAKLIVTLSPFELFTIQYQPDLVLTIITGGITMLWFCSGTLLLSKMASEILFYRQYYEQSDKDIYSTDESLYFMTSSDSSGWNTNLFPWYSSVNNIQYYNSSINFMYYSDFGTTTDFSTFDYYYFFITSQFVDDNSEIAIAFKKDKTLREKYWKIKHVVPFAIQLPDWITFVSLETAINHIISEAFETRKRRKELTDVSILDD